MDLKAHFSESVWFFTSKNNVMWGYNRYIYVFLSIFVNYILYYVFKAYPYNSLLFSKHIQRFKSRKVQIKSYY